jgi:predicted RNA-binding protein YlxR (DUF448 family)
MLARTPNDSLDTGPRRAAPGTERLCAVTGVVKPIDAMIRFVVSPDGTAVPDLKRRLPGRGVWITATRTALQRAIARKAFARSFRRDIRAGSDLVESTERLIERAALDALAMAYKAGRVAAGFAKAEAALMQGNAVALVHASDAAADGVRKLKAVLRRSFADDHAVGVLDGFTSAQLDLALGRSNVIHAALLAGPESKAFLTRAARLERFRTGVTGADGVEMPEESERNG